MSSAGTVGGGHTRWGNRSAADKNPVPEAESATFEAVPDPGLEDVEGLIVGSVQPEPSAFQSHVGPTIRELLGVDVDSMIAATEPGWPRGARTGADGRHGQPKSGWSGGRSPSRGHAT